MKPKLLDLFCCAGGAAMGYHEAGFDVVGVDINPQPRYPFQFHQMDWETALEELDLSGFSVIHASPPCQSYSCTKSFSKSKAPKLITEVRERLQGTEKPYVIENVKGARRDMLNPITLRGNMFGLQVIRDRLFEINPFLLAPPLVPVNGSTGSHRGISRLSDGGGYITVAGHNFLTHEARQAMAINWMNQKELAQAIPPAYTRWIGEQLMNVCFGEAVA
ncbi:DNA cytosine methyltransferase [Leptolyngbyaceae cyanobacterium CCMR0082]|uniref:DNA cytosine methyltransferase n=1 Tax=Adonisia turfae CCMR0082 TaxID=2304604 RepID=A0A6M0RZ76_9CYAN|nr:DNA cytosine methyltransferase [Adonisia turfae]NEZ61528.1 DNA cytosine methyltransferase [Adonisia turfae CCMR0082]